MNISKKIILLIFNLAIFIILIMKIIKILPINNQNKIKVFFGGSRSGNIGGTLTKIKKLKLFYGESIFNFNIIYLMSNTPYLNRLNIFLVKKLKIPIIHNQNGLFYPSWYKGNFYKRNLEIYKQYTNADFIFFQSNFCKNISYKFLDKPKCNNIVLYNAVDTNFYQPLKKQFKKNKNFSFLITGKFNYNLKDSLILSIIGIKKCIKEGFNFNLNIYGFLDSKLNNLLQEKIKNLNLQKNVFINGTYSQETANKIYNNNDAFIYLIYKAPCSNSVLEALSSGLPVIYSNSGGTQELVGEAGIGLRVPDSYENYLNPKIEDIKEAMINIYNNYEEKSKLARKRALENFNIEKWFDIHSSTMINLLNGK